MPPSFTPPPALNFTALREKWLSGGEAADAVKPSQTRVGVIIVRWSLLIPCEEVNRAGVAEKVIPALRKRHLLYSFVWIIILFGAKTFILWFIILRFVIFLCFVDS